MSLPEGAFPRLNASMVHSGAYTGSIASVVGKAISFDGEQTVELECVDGGRVQIMTSPDFSFVPGMVVEIMGAVQEDRTIQYFVSRDLGDGFDFPNYNELISKVLTNPKYNDMFAYQ
ncbi:hypothetical protein ACHAXH_004247 [Discostella pseudostelligera]